MSDVQAMISAWQQGLPGSAWQSDAIAPDPAALGAWMEQQSASSGGLKLTRSADPLYDRVAAYLELQGIDLAHALGRADDARDAATSRTRATVHDIRGLALNLKRAERDLLAESRGFNEGATGFTSARLGEARARVDRLTAELRAACLDDPALARAARRAAG